MQKLAEILAKAEARGIRFRVEGDRLKADFPEGEKTERVVQWIQANREGILLFLEEPRNDAESALQGVPAELWEILQALQFYGGESAGRLLLALCRETRNLKQMEERLEEGAASGLWKKTERTDALGFPIWAYCYEPDVYRYPIRMEQGEI